MKPLLTLEKVIARLSQKGVRDCDIGRRLGISETAVRARLGREKAPDLPRDPRMAIATRAARGAKAARSTE